MKSDTSNIGTTMERAWVRVSVLRKNTYAYKHTTKQSPTGRVTLFDI